MTKAVPAATPLAEPVPLAHADWRYIDKRSLDDYRAADWAVFDRQRSRWFAENAVKHVLRMLACQKDDPVYAYTVNNHYHSLQTATRMLQAGLGEEDVVVGLLHDVGFSTCNETHGEFAATLMRPYISERNVWMLERHAIFQQFHCHEHPGTDPHERDRWRGHPHFAWTAEFVAKYDQSTINHREDTLPLEAFEAMVGRVFSQVRRPVSYE